MTIDEAIAHARDVAIKNRLLHQEEPHQMGYVERFYDCLKCAEEHEQLARWLEELKYLRTLFKCEAFRDGIDALRDRIYEHEKSTGQMPDMDIINYLVERLKEG